MRAPPFWRWAAGLIPARRDMRARERAGPVTLIGVSPGGIMARLAAHRVPHANVWRLFEWLTGERIDSDVVVARRAEIAAPLPVPATTIWSASDGIVNGLICRAPAEIGCRTIEVRASHMGVQHRPQVLRAVAAVLGSRRLRHPREGGDP